MKTPRRKVTISAGATWTDSALWLTSPLRYFDVGAVTPGWPTVLTVTAHGMPIGATFPIHIANSGGLRIDSLETPSFAVAVDANTLHLHANTIGRLADRTPRAALNTPKSLVGSQAKLQFRNSIDGTVLVELTSGSGITLGNSNITVALTPAQTRLLLGGRVAQTTGSAQLEIALPSTEIVRLWQYDWVCTPEWTREA